MLVGLPGRGSETEAWMRNLVDQLEVGQSDYSVAHYLHWDISMDPNVAIEAERLRFTKNDIVIAKSLGTMITLAACAQGNTYPSKVVFIGTPIRNFSATQKKQLIALTGETKLLLIQQRSDFTGTCSELDDLIGGAGAVTTVEIAGSDHVYLDTEELALIISKWCIG